jgi:hypothetical protein
MCFYIEKAGFEVEKCEKLSPFPSAILLKEVEESSFGGEAAAEAARVLNQNVRALNSIIFMMKRLLIKSDLGEKN